MTSAIDASFFLQPPPPGASRESRIRLDAEGRFWHEGQRVEHVGLSRAFASWVARHPLDGRFVLSNGRDWCYLEVEDTPYQVESCDLVRGEPELGTLASPEHTASAAAGTTSIPGSLRLSDGTTEALDPLALRVDAEGAVYSLVKGGAFEARFSRCALLQLAEQLVEIDPPTLLLHGRPFVLQQRGGMQAEPDGGPGVVQ